MRKNWRGRTRSTNAVAIVARKQAVPDAVSQFRVNGAAYGAGRGVTGGIRVIALWSPGTLIPLSVVALSGRNDGITPLVHRSMAALIAGAPKNSTKMTRSRYGDQARKISPGV